MPLIEYKKTSLPQLDRSFGSPTVDSAYNLCHEEQLRLQLLYPSDDHKDLVCIRVLGWMFHFAPEQSMLADLSKAIISCNRDWQKYGALGQFFMDFWIRPFRKYKGRTPPNSGHVSRPSFDTVVEQMKIDLVQYPKNHAEAKKSALVRDGFKCVLTGKYDWASCERNRELDKFVMSTHAETVSTQLAHIICESTNLDIGSNERKLHYAATAWAVLKCFGYQDMFKELNGTGIHQLNNVLTMGPSYHDLFDRLELWFEPLDDQPDTHRYRVGSRSARLFNNLDVPDTVEFTDHSPPPDHLPMPSKRYLTLHAACAKVANMSAAAEYLDELYRKREEGTVLASDGSDSSILHDCIWDTYLAIQVAVSG